MGEFPQNGMKKLTKNLHIEMHTIPIKKQRYASIDDWFNPRIKDNFLLFETVVADMGNTDYEFLVLIHALVEQYLCFRNGIKDIEVTTFDKDHIDHPNPGDLKEAPYHHQHSVATDIEEILSVALGVVWPEYEKKIEKTLRKWK